MITQLDRNNPAFEGRCKYSLILNQRIRELSPQQRQNVERLINELEEVYGVIDHAASGEGEAFVIRLKDKFAAPALRAYAEAAIEEDGFEDYAREVNGLAVKAIKHPGQKLPD